MIGVDQVRHGEWAALDGSTGVVGETRNTLLVGDVGDRRINPNGPAEINLCLMGCRTVDDRDGHDAGIVGRKLS